MFPQLTKGQQERVVSEIFAFTGAPLREKAEIESRQPDSLAASA
jgi:hypothetical protein